MLFVEFLLVLTVLLGILDTTPKKHKDYARKAQKGHKKKHTNDGKIKVNMVNIRRAWHV